MKLRLGDLKSIIMEGLDQASVKLVDEAAAAVQADMEARPVSSRDSISRFDRVLDPLFKERRDKSFWQDVEAYARSRSTGSWTPYMIIASYAQTIGAYTTPGFAAARRWMT